MSYLWDSNILRHYLNDHPRLLQNLTNISRQQVFLPVIVMAEQLRGRTDALLKAEPHQLERAQELMRLTQNLLDRFQILYFDRESLAVAERLKSRIKTRRRYADILFAAQTIAGNHILVTRNVRDFQDLLPVRQLQNWVDDSIH